MEGIHMTDVILNSGCSPAMVRQDLVSSSKRLSSKTVIVRCNHSDIVLYSLSEVSMELDGVQLRMKAATSATLPVLVLLRMSRNWEDY